MRKFLNPQLKRVGRSNSPSKKTEPLKYNAAAWWWDRKKIETQGTPPYATTPPPRK